MDTSPTSAHRTSTGIGSACLTLGFLLSIVVLTVRLDADWGRLDSVIARNPTLCWGIAVGLMLGGAALIKQASRREAHWRPAVPGQRFQLAVLYTRADCPLCEEAARTLQPYQHCLPPIRSVDIEKDSVLREEFGTCVPVLELDGRVRFRGHISEPLLRRLIEGTPPVRR